MLDLKRLWRRGGAGAGADEGPRAAPATVAFLFNLMLARNPSPADLERLGALSVRAAVLRLAGSAEFRDGPAAALEAGAAPAHAERYGAAPPPRAAERLGAMLGPDAPAPESWPDAVRALVSAARDGAPLAQAAPGDAAAEEGLIVPPPPPPQPPPPPPPPTTAQWRVAMLRLGGVLGRAVPRADIPPERAREGFAAALARAMDAPEFEARVLDPLMAGRPPRHADRRGPSRALRAVFADGLAGLGLDPAPARAAADWSAFLADALLGPAGAVLDAAEAAAPDDDRPERPDRIVLRRKLAAARAALTDPGRPVFADIAFGPDGAVTGRIAARGRPLPAAEVALRRHDGAAVAVAPAAPEPDGADAGFALRFEPAALAGADPLILDLRDGADGAAPLAELVLRARPRAGVVRRRLAAAVDRAQRMNDADAARRLEEEVSAAPLAPKPRLARARFEAVLRRDPAAALGWLAIPDGGDETRRLTARLAAMRGDLGAAADAAAGLAPGNPVEAAGLALLGPAPAPDDAEAPPEDAPAIDPALRDWILDDAAAGPPPGDPDLALAALAWRFAPAPRLAALLADAPEATARARLDRLGQGCDPFQMLALREIAPPALLGPDDLRRAALHLLAGNRETEAAPYADAALAHAPDDPEAVALAAEANRRAPDAARRRRALDLYAGLHAADPGDAAVQRHVVALHGHLARRDPLFRHEAAAPCAEALEAALLARIAGAPQDAAARLGLADLLLRTFRPDRARPILEDLAAEAPDDPDLRRALIAACDALDDPEGREAHARALLDLGDDDGEDLAAVTLIKLWRDRGEPERAATLPVAAVAAAGLPLKRELARNHFFLGDFAAAEAALAALLAEAPHDPGTVMLAAANAVERGAAEEAEALLDRLSPDPETTLFLDAQLLRAAARRRAGAALPMLRALDPVFAAFGCGPLALRSGAPDDCAGLFDRLGPGEGAPPPSRIGPQPLRDGPLVTVVMTAWNATDYIETSIRSVLGQSYRNLELIVVDDLSSDGTLALLSRLEAEDDRLRVIAKSTNDGTYVAKNLGLLQARGDYVALQDSDDWSHPDRIAKSVAVLEGRPDVMGLTTDWLRMTTDGEVVIKSGGQVAHKCCISLVFRRAPVLARLGFFDSVRIEADMEFIRRIALAFGDAAMPRLRYPLLFGRAHSASLTAHAEYGITRIGFTAPRRRYQAAQAEWHAEIAAGRASPYMPFPLRERRFEAPGSILPERVREAEA